MMLLAMFDNEYIYKQESIIIFLFSSVVYTIKVIIIMYNITKHYNIKQAGGFFCSRKMARNKKHNKVQVYQKQTFS